MQEADSRVCSSTSRQSKSASNKEERRERRQRGSLTSTSHRGRRGPTSYRRYIDEPGKANLNARSVSLWMQAEERKYLKIQTENDDLQREITDKSKKLEAKISEIMVVKNDYHQQKTKLCQTHEQLFREVSEEREKKAYEAQYFQTENSLLKDEIAEVGSRVSRLESENKCMLIEKNRISAQANEFAKNNQTLNVEVESLKNENKKIANQHNLQVEESKKLRNENEILHKVISFLQMDKAKRAKEVTAFSGIQDARAVMAFRNFAIKMGKDADYFEKLNCSQDCSEFQAIFEYEGGSISSSSESLTDLSCFHKAMNEYFENSGEKRKRKRSASQLEDDDHSLQLEKNKLDPDDLMEPHAHEDPSSVRACATNELNIITPKK